MNSPSTGEDLKTASRRRAIIAITAVIMNDNIELPFDEQLQECDVDFVIVSKNKADILNELDFKSEEEKALCDSIISGIERMAAKEIRNMNIVQLPLIGCVRINPIKKEFSNNKTNLSVVRKSITKQQYKDHVRSYIYHIKNQQQEKDREKLALFRIRKNNKKRYEKLFKLCGRCHAELFIKSVYWLKEVPFNQEWEEHYQSLK